MPENGVGILAENSAPKVGHFRENSQSGEYVLCLYFKDASRKYELAKKYQNRIELKYRYWKSDEDTIAGNYSKQFLNRLSSNDKKMFQNKRTKQ